MPENSRFWDGTVTGDAPEAPYDAATEFAQVLLALGGAGVTINGGGVWRGVLSELAASVPAANTVRNAAGRALVYGNWYENTAPVDVSVPTPATLTRIDRIVLRKSWSAQTVRITRIAGTEGGSAPVLSQSIGTAWDIPLVQVTITNGGSITLLDEREFLGAAGGDETLVYSYSRSF